MSPSPVAFCLHSTIGFFGLVLNSLGIYCLQKKKGGNKNQRLLIQNMSLMEISKTLYDFMLLTLYHLYNDWYNRNYVYWEVIELSLLTLVYYSFIMLSIERLVCVLMELKYEYQVTLQLIKEVVAGSWLIGMSSGVVMWAFCADLASSKFWYYISFDIAIIALTVIAYGTIVTLVQRRRRRLSRLSNRKNFMNFKRRSKLSFISFMLVLTFVCFNAIPDIIFAFHQDASTYQVVSFMWSFGFLIDPLIYIFLNKQIFRIATNTLKHGFVCNLLLRKTFMRIPSTSDDCSIITNRMGSSLRDRRRLLQSENSILMSSIISKDL